MSNPSNRYSPPKWLVATIIGLCGILCGIQLMVGGGATIYHDGPSYFVAWDALKLLHPDEWRPPVYPIFAGGLTDLFGMSAGLCLILIFQWLFYAISLLILYNICRRIGVGKRISSIVVIGVLFLPGMWVLNNFTVAESVSGSMIVLWVWLSCKYYETRRASRLYWSGFLLAILVFTKPVFIILIPIAAIFWYITAGKNLRQIRAGATMLGCIICALIFYAWQIARFNDGNFALTRASDDNIYFCLRQDGLIIPDEIPVDSIRERFIPFYEKNPGVHQPGYSSIGLEVMEFNWKEKKLMSRIALKNHPKEALVGTWERFRESATFSQTLYPEPGEIQYYHRYIVTPKEKIPFFFPFSKWFYTPLWLGWALLFAYLAVVAVQWRREHKTPVIQLLIGVGIFFAGMFTSIVGAMDSWGRLITPFNLMLVPITGYLLQTAVNLFRKA